MQRNIKDVQKQKNKEFSKIDQKSIKGDTSNLQAVSNYQTRK